MTVLCSVHPSHSEMMTPGRASSITASEGFNEWVLRYSQTPLYLLMSAQMVRPTSAHGSGCCNDDHQGPGEGGDSVVSCRGSRKWQMPAPLPACIKRVRRPTLASLGAATHPTSLPQVMQPACLPQGLQGCHSFSRSCNGQRMGPVADFAQLQCA